MTEYKITGFVKDNPSLKPDGNFYVPTLVEDMEPKDHNFKKIRDEMTLVWRYGQDGGRGLPIFNKDLIVAFSDLTNFPKPDTLFVQDIRLNISDEAALPQKLQNYLIEEAKRK